MRRSRERVVLALVLINVMLQVVDGFMTFAVVRPGLAEELNPLVRAVIEHCGLGPTVCLVKLFAIGLIGLVWPLRRSSLAAPALLFLGAFYAVIVLLPWTAALAG